MSVLRLQYRRGAPELKGGDAARGILGAVYLAALSACALGGEPSRSQAVGASEVAIEGAILSSAVTYSTRPIDVAAVVALQPFDPEGYRTYIDALLAADAPQGFCSGRRVDAWNGVSSQATCRGPAGSFASLTRVDFWASGNGQDSWQIEIGPDYGLGGAVFLDDVPIASTTGDIWQGRGEVLSRSLPIAVGHHVLAAYGMENCCDGATFGRYQAPGEPQQLFTTTTTCGNGVVDPGEACDDGNLVDGDGCSASCNHEICQHIADVVGHPVSEISRFAADHGRCVATVGAVQIDATRLAEEVYLFDANLTAQLRPACALIEQARALCQTGTYQQAVEPLVTRGASCHPGIDFKCKRLVPDYKQILGQVGLSFSGDIEHEDDSYCTGQVTGNEGYPLETPCRKTRVQWTCTQAELEKLQKNISTVERPLGWPNWSATSFRACAGNGTQTPACNLCRMARALTECVLPQMGARQPCDVPGVQDKGSAYAAFGNECFRIVETTCDPKSTTNPCPANGPHPQGRAFDINNYGGDKSPHNNGNLFSEDSKKTIDEPSTPREEIPPRFVALMLACGFDWGGYFSTTDKVFMACDPMHFELPILGTDADRPACTSGGPPPSFTGAK